MTKSLIINSPYTEPTRHWEPGEGGALAIQDGRRPASYEVFDIRNNTRRSEPLELVQEIRARVAQWRNDDCPGITPVTRALLEHWRDRTPGVRDLHFYFCQIEAIETMIWWVEAAEQYRQGVHIPGDGGPWERLCAKMATGTGKTTVMAMLITWQVLNAVTYDKRRKDFSKAVLIVAPGLTVKERLRVLHPGERDNFYDAFALCPTEAMRQKLNQAEILIENWHTLMPLREQDRSVVKKGKESDEAFARRVLGALAAHRDLIVINDEAHHAYRQPADIKVSKRAAEELGLDLDEATRWIEGLDRIHATRRINRCFDLSATPFAPTGRANSEAGLFGWIVSDFGLNEAIEAGLVKTPRVVVRDDALPDARTLKPKLYHLYRDPSVSEDLNRRGAQPHEALPKLVQDAYTILGADWRMALEDWQGHSSPPVMLTVCNRTETAARIEHYFTKGDAHWPEMHRPERTLRVDSRVLEKAEIGETSGTDKAYEERLREIVAAVPLPQDQRDKLAAMKKEELLREIVDTVGKRGRAGQGLQKVISVAMLAEGWDAKNVTHILGLRAFTSQLLCEQVIGRGLRRVSYETDHQGYFAPEYVNVFGVPLSVFQEVPEGGEPPPPPKPSTQVESLPSRAEFEIKWPNILRVDSIVRPRLVVDWSQVDDLALDPAQTPITVEIAPAVGGAANMAQVRTIDLEQLPEGFRQQRIVFLAARKAFDALQGRFSGGREVLVFQLIRLVEEYLCSGRIDIPSLFHQEPLRRRILYALNMDVIVQHLLRSVQQQNVTTLEPVFDEENPIGSTRDMRTWYTTKLAGPTGRSQISHIVVDSAWETHAANIVESSPLVKAYARNERLGFQVFYLFGGSRRRYLPDFIVRLKNGVNLVLEIKGQDSPQDKAKREAMQQWVAAVNAKGGFGHWAFDVAFEPARVQDVLARHAGEALPTTQVDPGGSTLVVTTK
jgi:type III restriction enzyme